MSRQALSCRRAFERYGSASPNSDLGLRQAFIKGLAARIGRPCSVALETPFDPATDLLRSRLLGPAMLPPDAPWPCNLLTEKPLVPLLQVNLSEPPFIPTPLRGFAWFAVFLDMDRGMMCDGFDEEWTICLYDDLSLLAPRSLPPEAAAQDLMERWRAQENTPHTLQWIAHHELMDWSSYRSPRFDAAWFQESGAARRFRDLNAVHYSLRQLFDHDDGTKLGGFPSCTQGELEAGHPSPDDPDSFILQLRATPGCFDLCDNSCTHIGYDQGQWLIQSWTS